MNRVAVLILNWNGRLWLGPCLEAVRAQKDVTFDTIVVDNGSTDDSLALIRDSFASVDVVSLGRNLGFGRGYNCAIARIDAPFLALLNNDTIVQPGWLAALLETLEGREDLAAAGSKLLQLRDPTLINHAGGRMTMLGSGFDVGLGVPDGPDFNTPGATGCASGAALLMRRDAFNAVGGFDERYFAYFDDVDLCWRFWLSGYEVAYVPRARVLHAYGGSTRLGRLAPLRIQHCQTNRLQNMLKHLELGTLARALPYSIGFDILQLASRARASDARGFRAYVDGSIALMPLLPRVIAERRRIQAQRVRSDAELVRRGVIAGWREAAAEWRRLERLTASATARR